MNNSDLLKLLLPVELDGVFSADIALEGAELDAVQSSAEQILAEMLGDTADRTLADWERVLGLIAGDQSAAMRRLKIAAKINDVGRLDRAYFIQVAAAVGFTVTVTEFTPFTCMTAIDQPIYPAEIRFVWQINVLQPHAPEIPLETIMNDLKPAHTAVIFRYALLTTEDGLNLVSEDGRKSIMREWR